MADQAQEWLQAMTREESLHPDLLPYVSNDGPLGTMLRHPILYDMICMPSRYAQINYCYLNKKNLIEKKIAEKNYSGALILYERPYRIEKFAEMQINMSDKDYWENLAWVWTDSENLWQYKFILSHLLNKRPNSNQMMKPEEKTFLESLPDEFVIYRGHHGHNRLGHSWTLSYGKAWWFAQRYARKRYGILKATIKKENVIAYFSNRSEFEIVVDPKNLIKPKSATIKRKRPLWMQEILDEALQNCALSKITMHGLWHWERVETNALTIAKQTKCDKLVVQLFALLHDCKRINEDDDPEHGLRAAEYVEQLFKEHRLPLSQNQKEKLVFACKFHNDGQISDDPVIGACWDADRLDLPRVGITPDPALLSTETGKSLIWKV